MGVGREAVLKVLSIVVFFLVETRCQYTNVIPCQFPSIPLVHLQIPHLAVPFFLWLSGKGRRIKTWEYPGKYADSQKSPQLLQLLTCKKLMY